MKKKKTTSKRTAQQQKADHDIRFDGVRIPTEHLPAKLQKRFAREMTDHVLLTMIADLGYEKIMADARKKWKEANSWRSLLIAMKRWPQKKFDKLDEKKIKQLLKETYEYTIAVNDFFDSLVAYRKGLSDTDRVEGDKIARILKKKLTEKSTHRIFKYTKRVTTEAKKIKKYSDTYKSRQKQFDKLKKEYSKLKAG